jgi:manganese transport protein
MLDRTSSTAAWRSDARMPSLPEVHRSVRVPQSGAGWRRLLAFIGPGYLVAVGYMDPGNWATDIAGGSQFGYALLCVIVVSNFMAILLQSLAARLGVATERDLAQACRDSYGPRVSFVLWIACEIAIIACDLAEIIGTAIALNMLFGLPLVWGVALTAFDVILILGLQRRGFRYLEAFVIALLVIIAGCFAAQLAMAQPDVRAIAAGFIPRAEVVANPQMLFIAIGILGATVMPHNLYLHSSIVQTRNYERTLLGKQQAIRFATIDSTVALMLALFVNASILILSASVFHDRGLTNVADIQDAHQLLTPLLGTSLASILFGVALLASGQNSTVTATLAGQIVMEGFLHITLPPWLRRLATRLIAIVPAAIVAGLYGADGVTKLLILSQVVLSLQLPFAVIPLVQFTSDRRKMGAFVSSRWIGALAWLIAGVIICLNLKLLFDVFFGGQA